MRAYNATIEQLEKALAETTKAFNNNIMFNRFDTSRTRAGIVINFTLKVKNSSGKGARRSTFDRHKLISACWHVHGTFFDELLKINPKAEIVSSLGGQKIRITEDGGNWTDANIGSMVNPVYASEACECGQLPTP